MSTAKAAMTRSLGTLSLVLVLATPALVQAQRSEDFREFSSEKIDQTCIDKRAEYQKLFELETRVSNESIEADKNLSLKVAEIAKTVPGFPELLHHYRMETALERAKSAANALEKIPSSALPALKRLFATRLQYAESLAFSKGQRSKPIGSSCMIGSWTLSETISKAAKTSPGIYSAETSALTEALDLSRPSRTDTAFQCYDALKDAQALLASSDLTALANRLVEKQMKAAVARSEKTLGDVMYGSYALEIANRCSKAVCYAQQGVLKDLQERLKAIKSQIDSTQAAGAVAALVNRQTMALSEQLSDLRQIAEARIARSKNPDRKSACSEPEMSDKE